VTDQAMLAFVDAHSRIADHESVVRLPARMRPIIMEATSRCPCGWWLGAL